MTLDEKIKKIADYYGMKVQLTKFAEECAEYAASFHKCRGAWDWYEQEGYSDYLMKEIVSAARANKKELGDVLLVAQQVEYFMETHPEFKEEMLQYMEFKADRQLKRIEQYEAEKLKEQNDAWYAQDPEL